MDFVPSLKNCVFWRSRFFYSEIMEDFVNGKLNGIEFAESFYDRILDDKEKFDNLLNYYQKEKEFYIEIYPRSFKFSEIIIEFEGYLPVYINEMEERIYEDKLLITEECLKEEIGRALKYTDLYFKFQ